jgi:hypothetical protein
MSRHPDYSRALARRAARAFALVLVVAASAGVLPASASAEAVATVVCWKRLINDWYDGRIDQAYPVRCYREAIRNLPEDVEVYSSAREDIRRALLVAIRSSEKQTSKKVTESTRVKPPPKRASNAPGNDTGPNGPATRDPDDEGRLVIGPGNNSSDSVPLPLIVLAALAMLLLAAAGSGLVTRRLQARKAPGADEPPPAE